MGHGKDPPDTTNEEDWIEAKPHYQLSRINLVENSNEAIIVFAPTMLEVPSEKH
jgi:hypothetical protein